MLRWAKYLLLLAAVCCLSPPGLAKDDEAHRGNKQFDRVHSFTAAVVAISGCTNNMNEGCTDLPQRLHVKELMYGDWQDFGGIPLRCPDDLLASLLSREEVPPTTDCCDWLVNVTYLVILAVDEDGVSCLVHGEVMPDHTQLQSTTKTEDLTMAEHSIITKTPGLRKRRSTHVLSDTIKGIKKSELVADGDFEDNVAYGRISFDISGGKSKDVKSVLLLPSLWTVYAWIIASQRNGGKPYKNGLAMSQGRFYAVTRVHYDNGKSVSVIRRGSGLDRSTLSLSTHIEGMLPNYDDLSDPDTIESRDFSTILLRMNSTTLFSRIRRAFDIKGKAHFFDEETTITIEGEREVKSSAKLHVRHLKQKRTFQKGKVFIAIEADIEKAAKKDVSQACCDLGTSRAQSGKNGDVHMDACSSELQNCFECCERGKKIGTNGQQCTSTSKSNKGDRLCKRAYESCCNNVQSNGSASSTDKPTVPPSLKKSMRQLCCVVGSARALQGEKCIYLLPSLCGSTAQQCCGCCQKGMKDADYNRTCRTSSSASDCRNARGVCCEHVNELKMSQSQVITSSEPPSDKVLVKSFNPAGSIDVSGIVSDQTLSPISIHVGLNLSSPGQSKILCTVSELPVDMSDQRLHLIMSISCWPFAWLLGVESTSGSPNLFYDIINQLDIKGSMIFNDENGEERKLEVIYKAHVANKNDLRVDLTINGMFPLTVDAGPIIFGEYKANVSKWSNGEISPAYKVVSIRNDVTINSQHFYVGIILNVFVKSSKEMQLPVEQDIFVHEKKFAFDNTRNMWYLYLTSHVSTKNVDQFTWPGQIPGGRTYIDPSTSPEQGWVFATGTFTGIISQIEFDEVELVLNLNKADYQGSIQSVIRNWNANTAAISMLEVLPLDLPFCLLYAMNRAQISLVSLVAEVIIDSHHIVRLIYDVTTPSMVHVSAYGSLPRAINSVVTVMDYQLSVIQTSPVDTFIGTTSKILVGNQTLPFTLQGKAVWKRGENGLASSEVKISKTIAQADQEQRSLRTVSVLESVQSPDFSDACCLFGHYLASGNGKCRKTDFPDVCDLKKARKCCKCCLAGHHEATNSLKTPIMCLDKDFKGNNQCKKSAMDCCQRYSHISVTDRVPMGHIRGILSGSVNSLPIKDNIIAGQFENGAGGFAVSVYLGDLVHSLQQSSVLLLPIVTTVAWLTACPMRNGPNGLVYENTKFTAQSNVTFDHGDKQLHYFQTARVTRGGSLVINTVLDGNIPMLVIDDNEQLSVTNVSTKLVQVGQHGFHLVTDNYQAISSGEVIKSFSQVVTVSHDNMASSESLPLQQVNVQFSAITVDETLMRLTVKGHSSVFTIPENDTLDSCCAAGRAMALSGLECPQDTRVCSAVLAKCYRCCHRGLMAHQKSCSPEETDSVFCKQSYRTCCNERRPDSGLALPSILLPPMTSVDTPTTTMSRFLPSLLETGERTTCNCNGYSETCDAITGHCTACQHNTAGHQCDQCKEGYYGRPDNGQHNACKRCACPKRSGKQNFSPTCHLDGVDGKLVCDACAPGHTGRRCQFCMDGYYGRPQINGGCFLCNCNGNVDMRVSGNCDRQTGRCLKCLNNTTGDRCEKCKDGYFGDASSLEPCQRCMCHHLGSTDSICDYQSGKCNCKEGVGGQHCDQCVSGYWGFGNGSLGSCTKCNCCVKGSESCSQDTGKCTCKPGFTGRRCCKQIIKLS